MLEDRQAEEAVCRCEICGGEIYRGDRYYLVQDSTVCDCCVREEVAE